MGDATWSVHKFGGTSLADAERIAAAARLAVAESETKDRCAIVVSALAGATDELVAAVGEAAAQDAAFEARVRKLAEHHEAVAGALLGNAVQPVLESIERDLEDIVAVLRGLRVTRQANEAVMELVSGFGELWSAQVMCLYLQQQGHEAAWLDARKVLVVEHGEASGPVVDWAATQSRLSDWLPANSDRLVVITGYVASDPRGVPTTLKRNGSDFSASIFGRLLQADSITIWTDVDGVMSADPRIVPEAVVLPELSYDEAMELAYFGATVLHPNALIPAAESAIPIRIRNALRPDAQGTELRATSSQRAAASQVSPRSAVKGFSSMSGMALLNVEGAGMIGVPGIAHRVFGALREVSVSVVMISQASSEHSICVVVRAESAEAARRAIERALYAELQHGQIRSVDVSVPYSVLAAVGDQMVHTPGVAARIFDAISKAGVSVHAIAQGSSERNVSLVVAERDRVRALRAVHAGFYLSDQTLSVGLIGPGLVGGELLDQFAAGAEYLRSQFQIDLRVRAIMGSKAMLLEDRRVDLASWRDAIKTDAVAADLQQFVDHVQADHLPHAVLIDCTASAAVAEHYAEWMGRGIHVVTPNKRAGSDDLATYLRIRDVGRSGRAHHLYEATVGAGLPVITTLRDLIQTGDRVLRIEGVLSGTLSFLCNTLAADNPFSAAVVEAKKLGYTEPDPREDLSGMDVARKAVILARECGKRIELDDVEIESLVPESLRDAPDAEAFLTGLAAHDDAMEGQRIAADADDQVLRYVAVIEADGGASVGLRRYPKSHAFARTRGGDNIIAFTTERYLEEPLVVQGPGAGPAVTAGGVFADVLRLASWLGAPS